MFKNVKNIIYIFLRALGIVFYEIFNNSKPFSEQLAIESKAIHANKIPNTQFFQMITKFI